MTVRINNCSYTCTSMYKGFDFNFTFHNNWERFSGTVIVVDPQ